MRFIINIFHLGIGWGLEPFLGSTYFYGFRIPGFVPDILAMDALRTRIHSGVGLKRSISPPRWQIDPKFFSEESDFEALRFALEAYRKVSVYLRSPILVSPGCFPCQN